METQREHGVVQSWSETGSYGIAQSSDGAFVMVHRDQCPNRARLRAGTLITFTRTLFNKKPSARNVVIETAPQSVAVIAKPRVAESFGTPVPYESFWPKLAGTAARYDLPSIPNRKRAAA